MDETFLSKFYYYVGLSCVNFNIILYTSRCYIRRRRYKKLYQKLKQFKGFKYSHSTNQTEEEELPQPVSNTICHRLIYGTSGSGETSFFKYNLNQTD